MHKVLRAFRAAWGAKPNSASLAVISDESRSKERKAQLARLLGLTAVSYSEDWRDV
jgi:hypothetical protein